MRYSCSLLVAAVTLTLLALACRAPAPDRIVPDTRVGPRAVDAEAGFGQLERLVGRWTCSIAEDKSIRLAYRLTSAGSVLVETFTTPSGTETVTLFHRDGPRLLATHYCGQGNQPRLALHRVTDGTLEFGFLDATNLTSPQASHLDRLEVALGDDDHFEMVETYVAEGREDATRFVCRREY